MSLYITYQHVIYANEFGDQTIWLLMSHSYPLRICTVIDINDVSLSRIKHIIPCVRVLMYVYRYFKNNYIFGDN